MRLKLFLVGLFSILAFILPFSAFAQTPQPTPAILPKTEVVNHDYFGTGPTVDVEGTVNGDAYLAGGTILVNGTINGDILAAGGQITINGSAHNVRIAGGQIVIDGKVNGNITAVGGSVTITSGATIAGSIVSAGGQVFLNGPVGKTINIGAGQITIGNTIGGDASVVTQQLALSPDAKINGTLWYQSQQSAQINKGAVVSGKITHVYPPQAQKQGNLASFLVAFGIFTSIIMLIFEILIGLLLIALVPNYSQRVVGEIKQHLWLSLGIGILAWILIPLLVLLLFVTLVGIPIGILVIIAAVIFAYIGRIYAALFLGNWIFERTNRKKISQYAAFIVGIIILDIIAWIPILGWLFVAAMSAIGFGAVLILERDYYIELRAKKIL